MSKVTNKQIANAFRRAKVRMIDRRETYICHALYKAGRGAEVARIEVNWRLGGHPTVRSWLLGNGISSESEMTFDALMEYRLRWLDAIIEEFDPASKGETP